MSNQVTDRVSEGQQNASPQGGGGYPGYGNPSVAGAQASIYPSASVAPQQQRRGGMINKFKAPQVGVKDVAGNRQLPKQLLAEFLGTFLLVFFGIGSVITASGGGATVYWFKGSGGMTFLTPCYVPEYGKNFISNTPPDKPTWPPYFGGGPGPMPDPDPETPEPDTPAPDTPEPDTPAPDTPEPDTPEPGTGTPDPGEDSRGGRSPGPGGGPGPSELLRCSATSVAPDDLTAALNALNKYAKISHIATYVIVAPGSGVTPLHVSFAFGMAVACIAQALGHVSGAHLNPAVSFGLVAAGECSIVKAAVYSIIQIVGAVCGAGLLKVLTWNYITIRSIFGSEEYYKEVFAAAEKGKTVEFDPSKHTVGWSLGTSELGTAGYVDGIAIECFLTFILVLTVCGATDSLRKDVKGSAPLAIGFAVFLCHVVGIGYTGSSVNPARSIGPVFFTMNCVKYGLRHLVVYIIGPLLGGILAGVVYNIFFRAAPSEEGNPQGVKKVA